jgi:hypothetical protein
MAAVKLKQNFRIWTGNDLDVQFNVTDDNSSALNLTGVTARWAAAKDPYSTANSIYKTSTAGTSEIQFTNSTGGVLKVKLNESDTNALLEGVYYHELEIQDSTGQPFTVAIGHMTLEKSKI